MCEEKKYRLMIKFNKQGALRWISHLDTVRTLEKAMRRAGLPVALSQGFNPHQKMSLALPLSVGVLSQGEYLELELSTPLEPENVIQRLNKVLPYGLRMIAARELPAKAPALMSVVQLSKYKMILPAATGISWDVHCDKLLAASRLIVERTNRKNEVTELDIRPGILELGCVNETSVANPCLELIIETSSRLFVRPNEVLLLLCAEARIAPLQLLAAEPERLDLGVRRGDSFCSLMEYMF